ncbi:thiosulfate/3-mercaptopyruvate sulfurtransferase [Cryptococcus wingfieldii CBS 7118]|uniref:Thiosulfate/3-mercaptopyruvate sulfurtransferase n=1 Tax=Cryptococcus wingfieldii CBS 7118 TaxID=1295528 RepID=A0A1E3J315_9TREE|nr:thiosulfate/3-mercaptopyruvate sulfurtransferase [Cryptococcus wingfieldii CBS 7118]ODN95248.1 thiosulfate/3-mercaptopyruvate sulfurtransferase [Cryptococcus wingfieldii CBS 7118]
MRFPAPASPFFRRAFATSASMRVPLLVTPKQLKELPKQTTLPLDASWHMPNSPRSAVAEYLHGPRIPHARRFDLDEVAELSVDKNPLSLTHMLPTKERFQKELEKLGIEKDTHVVVYDSVGVFSSPRALYTFKIFGHDKVSVLDGGLPRWIQEGGEVEMGDVGDVGASDYGKIESYHKDWVRSYDEINKNAEKPLSDPSTEIILDHRPAPRFTGAAPEPRPNLPSGHMPNSLSLPFTQYLNPASDKVPFSSYKPVDELKAVLVKGVGGEERWGEVECGKKVVFSCGSGMTAAIGWLANELVKEGGSKAATSALYDESWTGYALREESKISREGFYHE